MPEENSTVAGAGQASQQSSTSGNQTGNDFILDFGSLGDDNTSVAEDVEVDSLSSEEEKSGDELGFDIDLGSNDEISEGNTEEGGNVESEDTADSDASLENTEGQEPVNDFDISMDFEGTNDEEITLPEDEEVASDEEITLPEDEEVASDEEITLPEDEEVASDEEITLPEDEEVASDEEITLPEDEEVASDEEITLPEDEEVALDEETHTNEEGSLNFIKNEDDNPEDLETTNQSSEGHLFHKIDEDEQNEISFDMNGGDDNESFHPDENAMDKPLFMGGNDVSANESGENNGEITFDSPEVPDNVEGLSELGIEPEEQQKQPEIGDLLGNSPIDLSKELSDNPENQESDLGNTESSVDDVEIGNEIAPEVVTEPTSEGMVSVDATQEMEAESTIPTESNEFLLDAPQTEPETQNIEQNLQPEAVENNVETQPEGQPQSDERSEMVNNAVSEINEQVAPTPEINLSAPVELNGVSSSQTETYSVESEGQVQSTLSLDQILDSELLSNPQYADNSKASPQNIPSSGSKTKVGIFVGVGVAALACCVAVLAFPSISGDRRPEDTVDTLISTEYPTGDDDSHSVAPAEPVAQQDPSTSDDQEISGNLDVQGDSDIPGGQGSAQVVSFPDDGDDSGDGEISTEPVPYVWSDDGQEDEPEVQEPVVEEIDANQILDVISSFKSQAETYYSHGEQHADKQLMKYSLRLISVCDNYRDKVNNGEGLDSESLSTFKSTANKIISKIDTYLGGDDEVEVIREATIDGESYFEGKDEIKEYIYNNR